MSYERILSNSPLGQNTFLITGQMKATFLAKKISSVRLYVLLQLSVSMVVRSGSDFASVLDLHTICCFEDMQWTGPTSPMTTQLPVCDLQSVFTRYRPSCVYSLCHFDRGLRRYPVLPRPEQEAALFGVYKVPHQPGQLPQVVFGAHVSRGTSLLDITLSTHIELFDFLQIYQGLCLKSRWIGAVLFRTLF